MSPPPLPVTVGKLLTAATIFTLMVAPSMLVCTVEPTLALLAARKRLGGQAWDDRRARPGLSASCPDMALGADAGKPARGQAVARAERHRQRVARRALADETAGVPDGPAVPSVCRTPASSADEATAGQPRSADPGTADPGRASGSPGAPDTPSTVKTAGAPGAG